MTPAELVEALAAAGAILWFEGERLRFRAPKGAISPHQRAALAENLAGVVALLRARADGRQDDAPSSHGQRAMWLVQQQDPDSSVNNIVMAVRVESPVSQAGLRQAAQALVDRHPILRTTYAVAHDELRQHIAGTGMAAIAFQDVAGIAEDALRAMIEADRQRPFDLAHGPVIRWTLFTRGPADHVLLLVVHHIAADAWSLLTLADEAFRLYGEATLDLPAALARPTLTYAEYAHWQHDLLAGPEGTRLWDYWRRQLAAPRARMPLPTDRSRPATRQGGGDVVVFTLEPMIAQQVRELARAEGTTVFVVLLASFQAFLSRLCGTDDVIVGTATFGRSRPEFASVVGSFMNPLPLRASIATGTGFRSLVVQLRTTMHDALDAQELPFSLLVQRLQPERVAGASPLFDTFFAVQRFDQFGALDRLLAGADPAETAELGGLRLTPYPLLQQPGQFDLALQFAETATVLQAGLKYATELFDAATVQGFATDYTALLQALLAAPDQPLATFPGPRDAAAALIGRLAARDIHLRLEGDKLRVNAPKGALDEALRAEIAAGRAGIIAALRTAPTPGSVARVDRHGPLPVSSMQQRLWFMDRMDPGRPHYTIGGGIRFAGRLDVPAMQAALRAVVARHEALRMAIGERDGQPWLRLLDQSAATIALADVSAEPETLREQAALSLAEAALRRPFDLAAGRMAGFLIVRLSACDHILVATMHHAVSDGWSLAIILGELGELYEAALHNRAASLPPVTLDYVDYAGWERDRIASGRLDGALAFWKQALAGAPALLELPTDRPRPATQGLRGRRTLHRLDDGTLAVLKACATAQGATLFMTMLAVWQVLMHRMSGQDDLVIGTPVANRDRSEFEGVVGCLVNNLPLRAKLGGNPSFAGFLDQVKATLLAAFDHRELPFNMLVEAVNPERGVAHAPVFQVLFTFMSFPVPDGERGGLRSEPLLLDAGTSRFDLTIELGIATSGEHQGKLGMLYEYDTDLFDVATIDRLHGHYVQLLAGAARDVACGIDDLPLQNLAGLPGIAILAHDRTRCLHQMLEASAAANPGAPAVTADGTTLSYAMLDGSANRLAWLLGTRGIGPGALVGVLLDRTAEIPVALAAVLKAGAAYVPLDPAHPVERLRYTLADAGMACVITTSDLAPLLDSAEIPLVLLDTEREALAAQPDTSPGIAVSPDSLAYVIYTSGSTGRPKGVEVEHRNVVSFLEAMRREPGLAPGSTLLAVTTLSFDIAVLELWLPLTVGARVLVASRAQATDATALIGLLATERVDLLQATPATWRLLLDAGWTGRPGLTALCGGEAMPRDLAAALLGRVGALWNMYGPTETTVWSLAFQVKDASGPIPIGRPIAGTQAHVLDPSGRAVPVGLVGELCIGGDGVARGYRNRPDLTAECFVSRPGIAGRLYRTGDMARRRADGLLDFLGRGDDQVKVRGYRIELGEVEAVLATHPGLRAGVVAVREIAPGDTRLVGYVVPAPGIAFLPEAARATLRARLPDYMVPGRFMVLQALPLTANGKVDRRALPPPDMPAVTARPAVLMTPLQRQVATVWRDVLRVHEIGLHDNFFDLGGHSLLLIKLHAGLKQAFGEDFPLVELFERTTVATQAARLGTAPDAGQAMPAFTGTPAHV